MKSFFKISLITLILGWIPLVFLIAISDNSYLSEMTEITLVIVSIMLCLVGTLFAITWIGNKHIWEKHSEINKLKSDLKERLMDAEYYIEALKRISINKAGITEKELKKLKESLKENGWGRITK